jgi:hypothetical protein
MTSVRRLSLSHIGSLAIVCSLLVGCTMTDMKRALYYDPEAKEENAMNGVENDKWGFVGQQGRGGKALEDERDPFKNVLMSKEARDIERNLGYK